MKVILFENIDSLGTAGEIINVKSGYARNYLIPKKLAVPATPSNMRVLHSRKSIFEKKAKEKEIGALGIKEKIDGRSFKISVKAGDADKLFGSVTSQDIEEILRKEGIDISHRNVKLEEPIKELGVYNIGIKLHPDVEANFKLWVVKEEE